MNAIDSLGPLEKDVLNLIWNEKCQTVREVVKKLQEERKIAYTTVMTIMSRLVEKELLERKKQGKTYLYFPTTTKQQTLKTVISQTISMFVDKFGDEALATFIDEADRLSHKKKRK